MGFDQFEKPKSITGINVTPLVDITLVLLIIFMVTTTYIVDPSIKVDLPKAVTGEETRPSTLSVVLTRQNELYLNGQLTNERELGDYIEVEVADNPDLQAVISADTELPYGRVVRLIDQIKDRGVRRYALNIKYTTAPVETARDTEPPASPDDLDGILGPVTRLLDTLRPHSLAILLHAVLVCALLLLSPMVAEPVEDVVDFEIVSLVQPELPPKEEAPPPEPEPPPPPPPRPAVVPPKMVMKKVDQARDFHPQAEELKEKADQKPEPEAKPSYEVPTAPPRFELSMEATVEGGDGIQVVAVAGGSDRMMADPSRPGDPDSDGQPTPPTYVPEVEVADTWEITEEPDPLNDRKIEPRYPIQAKAEGIEGLVVVRLWIDNRGKVVRARIAHSGGKKFDQSALEYCRKLRFRPAMANETPVASRIDWTVEFRI